jgi:hypothetical protein
MSKYLCLSAYTRNVSRGFQLGNQYIFYSIQAIKEDERDIRLRAMKLSLVDKLFKKKQ